MLISVVCFFSGKLIDIYRSKHNISASTGLNDPAFATGISDLIYESTKPAPTKSDALDDDLVNAWATGLGDDGLFGNNAPAMSRVEISSFNIELHIYYAHLYHLNLLQNLILG